MKYTTLIVILVVAAGGLYLVTRNNSSPAATDLPSDSAMAMPSTTATPSRSPIPTLAPKHTVSPTPGIIVRQTVVHNATIQNFAFSPATITVTRGDVVVFKNLDTTTHTVTSLTGAFDSGPIAPGTSTTLATADLAPGTYAYHCSIHTTMQGTLIVQ